MKVPLRDLPEVTKRRLRKAMETSSENTFVFSHSKRAWATLGLACTVVSVFSVLTLANGYRWSVEDRSYAALFSLGSFAVGTFGLMYWVRWLRSEFKDFTLINPLYVLRFKFDQMTSHNLLTAKDLKVRHSYGSSGHYEKTTVQFVFEDGNETVCIKRAADAQAFLAALGRFAQQVPRWFESEDADSLYSADLLYEFRQQEKELSGIGPPGKADTKWRHLVTVLV